MRRVTLLVAAAGAALLLSAGLAFAATYECFANRACIGTDGDDTLIGTSNYDFMDGRQGNDQLFGKERPDEMSGDAWDAPINGTSTDGNDLLRGGPGWDFMAGYGGGDELYGGLGGDIIFAEEASENRGEDTVYGNRGNDYIEARDETKDTISCGGGDTDIAFFDEGVDVVSDSCEYRNEWPDFEEGPSAAAATASAAEKVGAKELDALRAR